jgi:hypothetical protein
MDEEMREEGVMRLDDLDQPLQLRTQEELKEEMVQFINKKYE